MNLTALTDSLPYELWQGTMDKDVTALIYFSEEAVPESVFFAVSGAEKDGWDYAMDAVSRGAHVVVTDHGQIDKSVTGTMNDSSLPTDVTVLLVEDVRKAMAHMSCIFYDWPCRQLLTVGITGTKGKTSTAFMIYHILEAAGMKAGIIGTIKNGYDGHFLPAERTTPQAPDVQKWCRQMVDAGCQAVVIEVSSQALMHHRVEEITFDVAIFTNLSPDHIGPGEHSSFQEYMDWKSLLFSQCRKGILNGDDGHWQDMIRKNRPECILTYGKEAGAHYRMEEPVLWRGEDALGVELAITEPGGNEQHKFQLPLAGRFNGWNGAAAICAARELGIHWPTIKRGLMRLKIPGRVEWIETGRGFTVLVDYAHNGVALKSLLIDLKAYAPHRLIVVFGCGGDRDKNRRRDMGLAAAELADMTVITSDNPRHEEPMAIIEEIRTVVEQAGGRYQVIADRGEAIRQAVTCGEKGDIVLIAGKGHETYQLIGEKKIHFDDREIVKNLIEKQRIRDEKTDD
ncbi:MAG: UDP-N-acetylmuramoyl-L-alanyl-D-glutamate--2,6-diaminopimelate ligase [Firmicutes bacterium]|nr:UDP-N-acetylmuramoyl-L-alanyl-D-glutamate--2,6-diaminopimelate ligase [Bacillota bacterium]